MTFISKKNKSQNYLEGFSTKSDIKCRKRKKEYLIYVNLKNKEKLQKISENVEK